MSGPGGRDFYEVQSVERRRGLFVFAALILFYFLAMGLLALAAIATFGMLAAGARVLSRAFLLQTGLGVLAASVLVAVFHFLDARRFGAATILKRLAAAPPEPGDRYHQMFVDTVEEMRLACGLPRVRPYVIPSFAVNSLALVEFDGTPAVAVTEGLLADFTRDELQAVSAHELAHLSRGDATYVTLVCSLANFFDGIRSALEPDDSAPDGERPARRGGPPPFLFLAAVLSSVVMRFLSMLLSREREVLADAAAAEISRNPAALARALYKAHLRSTLVADFSQAYSPLFILAPALSSDDEEGFFSRVFNSHPPLMRRIKLLGQMAGLAPAEIIDQVSEETRRRRESRGVLLAQEELGRSVGGNTAPAAAAGGASHRCPRCRSLLVEAFYEGVPVEACPGCGGRLVAAPLVDRILLRREIDFSPALLAEAARFKRDSLTHPAKAGKAGEDGEAGPTCPGCGYRLAARPYNYQYWVPVAKCLACGRVWFDADRLEVLQILVEKRV